MDGWRRMEVYARGKSRQGKIDGFLLQKMHRLTGRSARGRHSMSTLEGHINSGSSTICNHNPISTHDKDRGHNYAQGQM